jgi:hypothetical protein
MMPSSSHHRLIGFQPLVAGVALKTAFDLAYIYHIQPMYNYSGLTLDFNLSKFTESYLISSIVLGLLGLRERTPSTMLLILGTYLSIIPLLSIYALQDRSRAFVYAALISFCISIVLSGLPRSQVLPIKTWPELFLGSSLGVSVALIGWMASKGAFSYFTFDLYAIYEYREELSDIVFVGLFSYLVDWSGRVVNIVVLIWALHRRNWGLATCAAGLQILLYGCTLNKSFLFALPFVALVYYCVYRQRSGVAGVGWLIILVIVLGMLESIFVNQSNITGMLTRRVLVVPAYFANEYYELFGSIGHVYWTNGLLGAVAQNLGALSEYPFAQEPPRLISEAALGHRETWANNGMFGTGFMHAGFVGMLGYGAVYGLWLYLIDCITVGRVPLAAAVSVAVVPATNVLTDSDLTTGLLTHGGMAATVMLWLWAGMTVQPRHPRPHRGGRPVL